jgi:hypothetical protein
LRIRANDLFVLAREKGQIGFAQQLRAQARIYLKELAAMDNRSDVGGFKGKNSQLD